MRPFHPSAHHDGTPRSRPSFRGLSTLLFPCCSHGWPRSNDKGGTPWGRVWEEQPFFTITLISTCLAERAIQSLYLRGPLRLVRIHARHGRTGISHTRKREIISGIPFFVNCADDNSDWLHTWKILAGRIQSCRAPREGREEPLLLNPFAQGPGLEDCMT